MCRFGRTERELDIIGPHRLLRGSLAMNSQAFRKTLESKIHAMTVSKIEHSPIRTQAMKTCIRRYACRNSKDVKHMPGMLGACMAVIISRLHVWCK